jgi:hypothetical protein
MGVNYVEVTEMLLLAGLVGYEDGYRDCGMVAKGSLKCDA